MPPTLTDPADRRAALVAMKLGALVRDHAGGEPRDLAGFTGGAGTMVGDVAWVFIDERVERGLGAALAWAAKRDAVALHVLADSGTGLLARRASGFTLPISVWRVDGRALVPATPDALEPSRDATAEHRAFVPTIVAGGADPVEEHGVVAGEVRGLEVCRVVDDPNTGTARLEVGVGAHDREVFQMMHGDRPTIEALADVVSAVAVHRSRGAAPHPLNQLAASRMLRASLLEEPELVHAASVEPADPPIARPNLKDELPCVALADVHGAPVAIVCSWGVDLDVVPYSVDAVAALRARGHAIEQCLVVAPPRDVFPIQQRLAALAATPTRLVGVAG